MKKFLLWLLIFSCMILTGCNSMKYDNKVQASVVITKSYSVSKINDLKSKIELKGMSYFKFKTSFDVQCLRKTHQGYYAVLMQDDGKKVFVFINQSLELTNVMVVDQFMSKTDFDFIESNQMKPNQDEILNFDPNTILPPISSKNITIHIVKEGIIIITYDSGFDEELLQNPASIPTVTSVDFIDNETLSTDTDLGLLVPYILEIDKIDN